MHKHKGDKHSTGNPIDLGLSSQSKIEGGSAMKLRGETNEQSQQPTSKSESVSSDRGKFPSK
jgi:hypothetical protein